MEKHYWKGYCNQDRTWAISTIQQIVAKYGSILDFKLFSDISLALVIEIEGNKIGALYRDLSATLLIEASEHQEIASSAEHTILFNITFGKGTGSVKQVIPEVPG